MSDSKIVKCSNCGHSVDIEGTIYAQLENEFNEKFERELKRATKLEIEKNSKEIKEKIALEYSKSTELLQKKLDEKIKETKEYEKAKAKINKLEKENKQLELNIKKDLEASYNKKLQEQINKVNEESELKLRQKDEQLEQVKKQVKITQQKAEQGSMQLQGEAQELAIKEYLSKHYPFDEVIGTKKGARGADCIQIVNTRNMQNYGSIYYESKRTKQFQKPWIEKFKSDMREKNVDVGVLITQVLPKELERMGIINGIWICTFEEFKSLSLVLRDSIIKISQTKDFMENKSDKMNLLYSYLTSSDFKMKIEAIAEGFIQMQNDLEVEKRSMNKIWSQREKQIEKVLHSTIGMHSSLRGIAGNDIGDIDTLGLSH